MQEMAKVKRILYTNFMQKFIENLGYRKLAIIMIAGSVLVLVFLIFTFIRALNPSPTTSNPTSNTNETSDNTTSNSPNVFSGKTYQITLPANFSSTSGNLSNGGTSDSFVGKTSDVRIETYDGTTAQIADALKNNALAAGLKSENTILFGTNVTVLTGVINLPAGVAQQKIYVFEKNGNIYKIMFTYLGPQRNSVQDEAFGRMLSSMSFN